MSGLKWWPQLAGRERINFRGWRLESGYWSLSCPASVEGEGWESVLCAAPAALAMVCYAASLWQLHLLLLSKNVLKQPPSLKSRPSCMTLWLQCCAELYEKCSSAQSAVSLVRTKFLYSVVSGSWKSVPGRYQLLLSHLRSVVWVLSDIVNISCGNKILDGGSLSWVHFFAFFQYFQLKCTCNIICDCGNMYKVSPDLPFNETWEEIVQY